MGPRRTPVLTNVSNRVFRTQVETRLKEKRPIRLWDHPVISSKQVIVLCVSENYRDSVRLRTLRNRTRFVSGSYTGLSTTSTWRDGGLRGRKQCRGKGTRRTRVEIDDGQGRVVSTSDIRSGPTSDHVVGKQEGDSRVEGTGVATWRPCVRTRSTRTEGTVSINRYLRKGCNRVGLRELAKEVLYTYNFYSDLIHFTLRMY